MSLSNVDRSDLEMLHIIDKATDANGLASSEDIANEIGLSARNGRSAAGRVSSRLSWMARLGLLECGRAEFDLNGRDRKEVLWMISDAGKRLMEGKLSATMLNAIERDDPGAHLLMMRKLTQRAYVNGDAPVAAALRREYQHNAAQRVR